MTGTDGPFDLGFLDIAAANRDLAAQITIAASLGDATEKFLATIPFPCSLGTDTDGHRESGVFSWKQPPLGRRKGPRPPCKDDHAHRN